jgi:hypothetical protein
MPSNPLYAVSEALGQNLPSSFEIPDPKTVGALRRLTRVYGPRTLFALGIARSVSDDTQLGGADNR